MRAFEPRWLAVERRAAATPMVHDILRARPDVEVIEIDDWKSHGGRGQSINQRFVHEKEGLILAVKDGQMVKQVDRDLYREIPHEYYIIHAMGCPFDCQYCFLFDYLDHQVPTLFVNTGDILSAMTRVCEEAGALDGELVFHAGEFSDALAFDHLTNLSSPLILHTAELPNARLELRTKSDNVANLLSLQHRGKTTVSWTFSPEATAARIELRTASLEERLSAARACQDAGYPIGLRLDPIVHTPGWEDAFSHLIERIFEVLDPAGIRDCSLGIYRATPRLQQIVRRRFPQSMLHSGEMELAGDGKYRYIRPVRARMLETITGMLRANSSSLKIELCMESPEVAAQLGYAAE